MFAANTGRTATRPGSGCPWRFRPDLRAGANGAGTARVDVEFELELKAGSPVLEVRVTVDNQADSHRLRLLVPGQEHEGFSVSDNQFGMIRRPVRDEAMDVWEKEGLV